MRRIGTTLLTILATLSTACMVEPPDEENPTPEEPMEPANPESPPEVILDPLPETTFWYSVPVTGRGPENGTLLVETPARGAFATDISAQGTFCIDVPLDAGQVNTLSFQALDAGGVYSEKIQVQVRQEGAPPNSEPLGEPINLLRNASVERMSVHLQGGELAFLTDGVHSNYARLSNDTWDDDYLILRLGERRSIERIRVLSTVDCPMNEYVVMVSDREEPGDAIAGSPDWMVVEHVREGSPIEELSFAPTVARFVGIQFLSKDCGAWYETGKHQVREIEAFTPPPPPPPSPEAPSCIGF